MRMFAEDMSKTPTVEENKADTWFRYRAEPFLRSIGVRECLQVGDVGCHKGQFTIPAARIVGSCGTVYGIDKTPDVLTDLRQRIKKESCRNIRIIHTDLSQKDAGRLPDGTLDIVLLFDILHRGYLPEKQARANVLKHVYRLLKPGGVLSCFPTHLKKFHFTFAALLGEIAEAGFVLEGEFRPHLVHDGRLVRGRVFRFRAESLFRYEVVEDGR